MQKVVFLCFSERCHGNMYNLNVIVVLEFISRDLYLLFAILLSSKFQNSFFYQHMRPKSGLKFPRPLHITSTQYADNTLHQRIFAREATPSHEKLTKNLQVNICACQVLSIWPQRRYNVATMAVIPRSQA